MFFLVPLVLFFVFLYIRRRPRNHLFDLKVEPSYAYTREREQTGPWPGLPDQDWFLLGRVQELPLNQVRRMRLCEDEYAVARTSILNVCVMEAYCKHLGAHLGYGGKVTADGCIQCPFHGWKYTPTGELQSDFKVEQQSIQLRTYPVERINDMILVWKSKDGITPPSKLPSFWEKLQNVTSLHCCYSSSTVIQGHVRDIMENGCDLLHFPTVHHDVGLPTWLIALDWDIQKPWKQEGKSSTFSLITRFKILGHPLATETFSHTTLCNSNIIIIEITSKRIGHYYIIHALIPTHTHQVVDNVYYFAEKSWKMKLRLQLIGKLADWTLRNDFPIWKHKRAALRPLLQPKDGNIAAFRRWYNQFLPIQIEEEKRSNFVNKE